MNTIPEVPHTPHDPKPAVYTTTVERVTGLMRMCPTWQAEVNGVWVSRDEGIRLLLATLETPCPHGGGAVI